MKREKEAQSLLRLSEEAEEKDIRLEKRLLRDEMRRRAERLDPGEMRSVSGEITRRVVTLPEFRNAETLLAFMSLPSEPDTRAIIQAAWQSGKTVLLPRCEPGRKLVSLPCVRFEDLERSPYGILEPRSETLPQQTQQAGLALIPCMAATAAGKRLGHGGGYYDRYLADCQVKTACLCTEAFLLRDLPTEPRDRIMDMVITEKAVYR